MAYPMNVRRPINITGLPSVKPALETRPGGRLGEALEGAAGAAGGHNVAKPFTEYLSEQVQGVNELQKAADEAVGAVATGRSRNIHEMMIALDKADVSFRMMTKVRSKVIDAYHEIMRMSI